MTSLNKANLQLRTLGFRYHDYIPVFDIDSALVDNGFDAMEAGIYCGREGRLHEYVGQGRYLTLTWHKLDTGKYEIVAYVN